MITFDTYFPYWGFVYVLKSTSGLHKIGYSKDIEKRLDHIRRDFPNETIEVVMFFEAYNMKTAESKLHREFDKKRVHHEWFSLCKADISKIKKYGKLITKQSKEVKRNFDDDYKVYLEKRHG